jgi:hypothetical protein
MFSQISLVFRSCESVVSVSFNFDSQLRRIEDEAFRETSVRNFVVPKSVETISALLQVLSVASVGFVRGAVGAAPVELISVFRVPIPRDRLPSAVLTVGVGCLAELCRLTSVAFDAAAELHSIEEFALRRSYLRNLIVPKSVKVIANK